MEHSLQIGNVYAVTALKFSGEILVYIKNYNNLLLFFSIINGNIYNLSQKDFDLFMTYKVQRPKELDLRKTDKEISMYNCPLLKYVETLPKDVLESVLLNVEMNYKHSINNSIKLELLK